METLKIAMATDWFLPRVGGVEYHVATISRLLTERGHEVHVLTNSLFGEGEYPYKVYRIRSGMNLKFWNVRVGYSTAKEIANILKSERYDIVHGHNYFSPISATSMNIASGIYGIPSILTVHSITRGPLNWAERWIARQVTRKISAYIAISSLAEEYIRKIAGKEIGRKKIWNIPNGVDTTKWTPPKSKESLKREIGIAGPIIVTASRLSIRKRVVAVPKIAKIVVKEHPEAKFLIIGDGVERKNIVSAVKRAHLENNVIMPGAIPREQLIPYIQASDIYLNPTKIEALGMAVIEAQACGVPGIGYAESGVKDIIIDGYNGYLYHKDAEAAEDIIYLLDNPGELKKMSKNARKIAEEKYEWNGIIKQIERAYVDTIQRYQYEPFRVYEVWKKWYAKSY
ncbi:MAG: glycosyltransferase family 4 protein [Candidatus Diapherotrites archaeon]|nr:glycosyltransferase family 4 protein [Candidatus Diapherotrites archaeon]